MRRLASTTRAAVSLLVVVAVTPLLGSVGSAAPVAGTSQTYTLDADWDKGTLLNVNHDAPNNNQLQLNKITKPFPFVNIAASGRGTAVRIDVNTGKILGEYFTAPNGMGRDPSRTTVDKLGNVWVANRAEFSGNKGSVARIGLLVGGTRANADGTANPTGQFVKPPFEYNTCPDRNGDGLIKTSNGLGNILAWSNAGGADSNGGVSTADDECIINYTRVTGTGTRTVAIDANNDVWVGGLGDRDHEKLSGLTGQPVPGTQFNLGCGGYGGLVDGKGTLWSARELLRFVPNASPPPAGSGVCFGNTRGDYGLGIDPRTGHIWHSSLFSSGLRLYELDTAGNVVNSYPQPFGAQGVAVDGKGHVWMAEIFGSRVWHLAPDPANPAKHVSVGVVSGFQGVTGVAVDANGKVWGAEINGNRASRIDPNAGPVGGGGYKLGAIDLSVSLGAGASPYNYSDMTGFVAIGATSPTGTWTVVQDGGGPGTKWGRIRWNTEPEGKEPAGTSITVEARAADSEAGLASQPFVAVSNATPFALTGRFIEVRATLRASPSGESPVLSDITIDIANKSPAFDTPPTPACDSTLAVNTGSTVTFDVQASDPDADQSVTLAGAGVPSGATMSPALPTSGNPAKSTFSWAPTPADEGTHTMSFTATDPFGAQATCTISIRVVALVMTGRAFVAKATASPLGVVTLNSLLNDTGEVSTNVPADRQLGTDASAPPVAASVLNASVVATVGSSESRASVADVLVDHPDVPRIHATGVTSSSRTTCQGSSGSAELATLSIGGASVPVPASPAPNTTIALPGGITLILNEQVATPGELLVNAVHITSPTMDIVLASARSDIHNCL
jgi:hypothetical protein